MENWYITPDILEIKALDGYKIYIKFENGEEKIYNMEEMIKKYKIYSNLENKEYFKKMKIRKDTIEWENGEDIAPEYLYHDSIPIKNM